MKFKYIALSMTGLLTSVASVWVGTYAYHKFAGEVRQDGWNWPGQPIEATTIILVVVGAIVCFLALVAGIEDSGKNEKKASALVF